MAERFIGLLCAEITLLKISNFMNNTREFFKMNLIIMFGILSAFVSRSSVATENSGTLFSCFPVEKSRYVVSFKVEADSPVEPDFYRNSSGFVNISADVIVQLSSLGVISFTKLGHTVGSGVYRGSARRIRFLPIKSGAEHVAHGVLSDAEVNAGEVRFIFHPGNNQNARTAHDHVGEVAIGSLGNTFKAVCFLVR